MAWAGILVNLPLFYIDDWINFTGGALSSEESIAVGFLVWRVTAVLTLSAYLVAERRAPRDSATDRRYADGLASWFILLGGWFGIWFEINPPSYALYGLTLLVVAVLIHAPATWRLVAYGASYVIALAGAWAIGTPPLVVIEWAAAFAILTGFAVVVDRALYAQAYQTVESEWLLGKSNRELETALAELRETQDRLLDAERQTERLRISRDLHDSVGAQLSNLIAGVELARLERRATNESSSSTTLDEVEEDAREALGLLRETVWALSATPISVSGLAHQLRRFVKDSTRGGALTATVHVDGNVDRQLGSAAALHLLRIAQEAVQNAVKHSAGSRVDVRLSALEAATVLEVEDDGTFRPPVSVSGDGAPSGFGMHTMRERAEALGSRLDVVTTDGTRIRVEVRADST